MVQAFPMMFPLIRHLPLGYKNALACRNPRVNMLPQSWLYVTSFDVAYGVFWVTSVT